MEASDNTSCLNLCNFLNVLTALFLSYECFPSLPSVPSAVLDPSFPSPSLGLPSATPSLNIPGVAAPPSSTAPTTGTRLESSGPRSLQPHLGFSQSKDVSSASAGPLTVRMNHFLSVCHTGESKPQIISEKHSLHTNSQKSFLLLLLEWLQ